MAGELWRRRAQIAKETTPGVAVAATRKIYLEELSLTRTRADTPFRPAVGRRDNVVGMTQGPNVAGGRGQLLVSPAEAIEWFLLGLQGGVTPSTPHAGVYKWVFNPAGTTLDSATVEYNDGANDMRAAGVRVNTTTFAGNVRQENRITLDLFEVDRDDTFTPLTVGLSDRTPDYLSGWQTNIYLDAVGGSVGTTKLTDLLAAWNIVVNNNLDRKYLAADTLAAQRVTQGVLDITCQLTFDAAAASYLSELANWDAITQRQLRVEFIGPPDGLAVGYRAFITIDINGAWMNPDVNQTDQNTRAGRFDLQYIYNPSAAYALVVTAQNARAAAW